MTAHHVDYCFVPNDWVAHLLDVQVGSRELWAKAGRSEEYFPLVVDFEMAGISDAALAALKERRSSGR